MVPTCRTLIGVMPGCVIDIDLYNETAVTTQRGVLTGAPTVNKGVELNGSSQYISYNDPPFKQPCTIICEFYPDFEYNDGSNHYLYDTTNTRYFAYKNASGDLHLYMGGTSIQVITAATYSQYWRVGQRNQLVVSSTTGDTDAWLNNHAILTNRNIAWTVGDPQILRIGIDHTATGSVSFAGKITHFSVHDYQWNALDVDNWWFYRAFKYRDRAVIYLPMNTACHDSTNLKTLDVSGNGNHASWTAGATAPTRLTGSRGYSFDGGDILTVADSPSLNEACGATQDRTVMMLLQMNDTAAKVILEKGDNLHFVLQSNASVGTIKWRACNSGVGANTTTNCNGKWVVLIGTSLASSPYTNILHVNGKQESSWNGIAPNADSSNPLTIGARYGAAYPIIAKIGSLAIWPYILPPLQIRLETRYLLEELHGDP